MYYAGAYLMYSCSMCSMYDGASNNDLGLWFRLGLALCTLFERIRGVVCNDALYKLTFTFTL